MNLGVVSQVPQNLVPTLDGKAHQENAPSNIGKQSMIRPSPPDVWGGIDRSCFPPRPEFGPPGAGRWNGGFFPGIIDRFLDVIIGLISLLLRRSRGGGTVRPMDQNGTGPHAGGNVTNVGGREAVQVDGAEGFLWKPVSDSDGKLAVLLPKQMTGNVARVTVRGPDGRVLDNGRSSGVGNGDREHFRFSKPGGTFPQGVTVEVHLKNGSVREYAISNPNVRHD